MDDKRVSKWWQNVNFWVNLFTTQETRVSSGQAWSYKPYCCQVHRKTSARTWSQQRQCEAWQQALARRLISSAGIRGLLPDWWLSERQPDELPCSDMAESHKAIVPGIKGSCGAWSPSARCRGTQRWSALVFMKKFENLRERQVNPRTRHAYAGTLNSQVKSTRPFSSSNPLDWDIETRIKIFDNTMLFYNPAVA